MGFALRMERKPPAFGTLFAPEVIVDCSFGGPLVPDVRYRITDPLEKCTSFVRWELNSLTDAS